MLKAVNLISKEEYQSRYEQEQKESTQAQMTKQQEAVTKARNCDILVSAAAGSGKTWVLVKRIIKRVIEERIDISSFLIVTFTNAAAAEMRERIAKAIEEKLEEARNEQSDEKLIAFLTKQTTLVYQAQISTIDSFCQNIVKQYFMEIDMDPNFTVVEDSDLAQIRTDVMEKVLEKEYEKAQDDFIHFVECYIPGREDSKIEKLIFQLYRFSMAHPSPESWFEQSVENIKKDSVWYRAIFESAGYVLEELKQICKETYELAKDNGGTDKLLDALTADSEYIDALYETVKEGLVKEIGCGQCDELKQESAKEEKLAEVYDKMVTLICGHDSFPRIMTKGMDEEAADILKVLRDEYKQGLDEQLGKKLFAVPKEKAKKEALRKEYAKVKPSYKIASDRLAVLPDMLTLFRLCRSFKQEYEKEKKKKHIVEFADLEHMALAILTKEEGTKRIPSEIALKLRAQYQEIMIDEYQDSSYLQEAILESIAGGNVSGYNRFMVGDMKQSIYRFRLASPELFVDKYNHFSDYEEKTQQNQVKIELDCNFRSSANVLETCNYLFYHVMKPSVGNIDYDEKASLKPGAHYNTPQICPEIAGVSEETAESYRYDNETELLLYEEETGEDNEEEAAQSPEEDATKQEARMVALKIKEMMGEHPYLVKDDSIQGLSDSCYRPVTYRDIVILLRSPGALADTYVKVLSDYGVPAFAESRTGYFSAMEVRNVLSYLSVLNNATLDIPLAAVLRSSFVGLDAKEMSLISIHTKDCEELPLIRRLEKFVSEPAAEPDSKEYVSVQEKVAVFLKQLETYRTLAKEISVSELISHLYEDSGYLDYVGSLPAGERRKANLYMLLEKARNYEKTNFCSVFQFINYIEQLHKYETDFGEASLLGEQDNVVRIMSIHKSKGLEFPVVFVSSLSKQFNKMDMRENIVLHADYGVGPYLIDPVLRTKHQTMMRRVIQFVSENDMLGEELRILYVALTRAKDKLILTGTVKNLEEKLKKVPFQNGYLSVTGAKCYLDWILQTFCHHGALQQAYRTCGICPPENDENRYPKTELSFNCFTSQMLQDNLTLAKENHTDKMTRLSKLQEQVPEEKIKQLRQYLSYAYPYEEITMQKGKYSVSQLKRSDILPDVLTEPEEKREIPDCLAPEYDEADILLDPDSILPDFLRTEKKTSGAETGTRIHKFMEKYDFSKGYEEAEYEKTMQLLKNREKGLTPAQFSKKKLKAFFETSLAREMMQAQTCGKLYKEVQFVVGFPLCDLAEDIGLSDVPQHQKEETILVQGMLDACYEREDGTYVVVDYKTDRVNDASILVERYQKQLHYYAKAVSQVKQAKRVECVIYSFHLDCVINLK